MKYIAKKYDAKSGRGTGKEKVVCVLLTSPNDVLEAKDNHVLNCLNKEGVSSSLGIYFYRFKKPTGSFIKIGECTRKDGISVRFKRGWHGTETYSDTYLRKRRNGSFEKSEFLLEIEKISKNNPAYFVFYEQSTSGSYPKIDEVFAYRMHKRLFKCGTKSPERMNSNPLLARRLVWHKTAFSEVVKGQLPDGTKYG